MALVWSSQKFTGFASLFWLLVLIVKTPCPSHKNTTCKLSVSKCGQAIPSVVGYGSIAPVAP